MLPPICTRARTPWGRNPVIFRRCLNVPCRRPSAAVTQSHPGISHSPTRSSPPGPQNLIKATHMSNTLVSQLSRSKTCAFSCGYSTLNAPKAKTNMATSPRLASWFPHAQGPLIINAPMLGAAGAAMATEVHKAGGIGFVAAGFDFSPSSPQLADLDGALATSRALLSLPADAPLPLGVGFITSHETAPLFAANVLPILARHRAAAVWLFAPHPDSRPHAAIIAALRDAGIRVFVQVGNVAAAREAASEGADVLVAQGADAGGHQFARGCGVVALVPEIASMLSAEFPHKEISLVAAGGIVEGRGVAAALALGAEGVVMGTRFVATPEAMSAQLHKDVIVNTKDGAVSTWKSDFHDKLVDSKLWKPGFDGRAVVGEIHREFHLLGGQTATVEESRERLRTGWDEEEGKRMIGKWAGAGVGLVDEIKPAGEVVVEAREAARRRIKEVAGLV